VRVVQKNRGDGENVRSNAGLQRNPRRGERKLGEGQKDEPQDACGKQNFKRARSLKIDGIKEKRTREIEGGKDCFVWLASGGGGFFCFFCWLLG